MHNIYVIAIVCALKKPEKDESSFFCKIYFSILSKDLQHIYSIYVFINLLDI